VVSELAAPDATQRVTDQSQSGRSVISPPPNSGIEASFESRIRDAVQAALRYPGAARMMNLHGRAHVSLDYHEGSVSNLHLAQSAGSPLLDNAAMIAVREAQLPQAPPEIGDRLLRLLVWVDFGMD
jgi:protein TonB